MPELPEVETMVRGLRPEIEGRRILDVEFCPCTRKPITVAPRGRMFRSRMAGRIVRRVQRLAKRVVLELDDQQSVVIEPRMTGLMLVSAPPTQEHRRLCWHLYKERGHCSSFEFWDRRGLGTVRLLRPAEMEILRASLGCDALQMTVDQWVSQLRGTGRAIKVAMLDQTFVAGIGNLYASEILHRAGVSPLKPAAKLRRPQIERIAEETQAVLREAIRYEGSTLSDGTYRNALNKDGGYQNEHRVYAKAGEFCGQCCKGIIKRIVQAQRATFYCPRCQK
ncbi:MAG: bifunctional DNA-formamidopyrimidine glycosylase/DNA-(apurinic or apyrimidinic site) lyase [Planctomycetaceae bacterium]